MPADAALCFRGDAVNGLKRAISEIPTTKSEALKIKHAETIGMALTSISDRQIESTLKDFDEAEQ